MDKLKVVLVTPEQPAIITEIDSGLESLQKTVGGSIQVIYPFADNVGIICNDEGKIEGLPPNRALRDESGGIYDIIAGNFIVVGLGDDDFVSLDDNTAEFYRQYYLRPELFLNIGGKIVAVKL